MTVDLREAEPLWRVLRAAASAGSAEEFRAAVAECRPTDWYAPERTLDRARIYMDARDSGLDVGNTALLDGARRGDLAAVQSELLAGADPDARDLLDATALGTAAAAGRADLAIALIAAGADLDGADAEGLTPLLHALRGWRLEVAQALLEGGADARRAESAFGHTALHLVAGRGQSGGGFPIVDAGWRDVETLVSALAAGGADLDARDHCGNTALHYAVAGDQAELLTRLLLNWGAAADLPGDRDSTPLLLALVARQPGAAQALRAAGARGDARNGYGWTPDMAAAALDLSGRDRELSQLFARVGDAACVQAALDAGVPPASVDARGRPVLLVAVAGAHAETVRLLLARGADPEQRDPEGWTARSYAHAAWDGGRDTIFKSVLDALAA